MDKPIYKTYNKSNKDRARDLRKNMTEAEQKIWEELLRKKQTWYLFLRQKMINSFILDFYCSKLLLWIEIDGWIHNNQKIYNIQRDEQLRHYGIIVIRFTNDEVMKNINLVKKEIINIINERKKHLN